MRTADRPTSHAHAEATLSDAEWLAYVTVQACRLVISLIARRWPHLG